MDFDEIALWIVIIRPRVIQNDIMPLAGGHKIRHIGRHGSERSQGYHGAT